MVLLLFFEFANPHFSSVFLRSKELLKVFDFVIELNSLDLALLLDTLFLNFHLVEFFFSLGETELKFIVVFLEFVAFSEEVFVLSCEEL